MPRNILEVIQSISEDKTFSPSHNLTQIGRIAKGFAPMLTVNRVVRRKPVVE